MHEYLKHCFINIANIYIKVQFCNRNSKILKILFHSMIISHFPSFHLF